MRLDKFISNNTEFSRSEVRRLIKAQRIVINGEASKSADYKIQSDSDEILLDGKRIRPLGHIYIMLNKPSGYICANRDSQYPTVLDLLTDTNNIDRDTCPLPAVKDWQIAGRLDLDTTGLVFITNDGEWNHRITSPSLQCKKGYHVSLQQDISPTTAAVFAQGMQLDGESKLTRPARLEIVTPTQVRLYLSEGKYHQVKRMFAACGNHVSALHRESIAGIMLDQALAPGQYRQLRADELTHISANY